MKRHDLILNHFSSLSMLEPAVSYLMLMLESSLMYVDSNCLKLWSTNALADLRSRLVRRSASPRCSAEHCCCWSADCPDFPAGLSESVGRLRCLVARPGPRRATPSEAPPGMNRVGPHCRLSERAATNTACCHIMYLMDVLCIVFRSQRHMSQQAMTQRALHLTP